MAGNQQAQPGGGAAGGSRLGVRSISEASDIRDRELAVIFAEMRRASGVSKEQIAGRLATSVAMVDALEEGALSRLPEWNEVKRIVTAYAAQLGLDSRPILRRIQGRLGVADQAVGADPAPASGQPPSTPRTAAAAPAPASGPPQPPAGPPMPPSAKASPSSAPPRPGPQQAQRTEAPSSEPRRGQPQPGAKPAQQATAPAPEKQPRPEQPMGAPDAGTTVLQEESVTVSKPARSRMAGAIRGAVNWVLLIGFVAALGLGVWYAAQNPRVVWGAMDSLPEPIPRIMRSAWELVRPLDDGAGGPQVSDPDGRRSDKLP